MSDDTTGDATDDRIRVLLVDDHPIVRAGIAAVLKADPAIEIVGETDEAKHVLNMVRKTRPDVIVLDARLPDHDGMDAVEGLTKAGFGKVKVVMLTQLTTERVVCRSMEVGAQGFVVKSSDGATLRHAVHTVAAGDTFIDPDVTHKVVNLATKNRRTKGPYGLTKGELRVLALIVDGLTNHEIAERLNVSYETVKTHIRRAKVKLEVNDRPALIALLIREGIV